MRMRKMAAISAAMAVAALLTAGPAAAQDGWYRYGVDGPITVYFKTMAANGEVRVAWKCENSDSTSHSCSVGAGGNKQYRCFNGSSFVGMTESLGERATVPPRGEYVFPTDWACRGLGATSATPTVDIAAE